MVNNLAVSARQLSVSRGGRPVLHDINLSIERGSVTGLLGPSGCGKSTLMRAILGGQAKVSGTVEVLGEPAGSPALRHRVGYATQAASVYDDLTVRENFRYFASLLQVSKSAADAMIARVGLEDHASQKVESLSGGQRGRVSLGAALLGSPELLVLDEPTVGLDPVLREELWQMFHELAAQGTTLLVSSHVMDEALRCSQLILMREGQILLETTPDDLLARTGAQDPEAAFLRIIEQSDPGSAPRSAPPSGSRAHHGRHSEQGDEA